MDWWYCYNPVFTALQAQSEKTKAAELLKPKSKKVDCEVENSAAYTFELMGFKKCVFDYVNIYLIAYSCDHVTNYLA